MAERNQGNVPVREQGRQPQQSAGQQPQRGMSRRGSWDPWGNSILPSEFFSMNPFSMMRRMQDEMDRVFGAGGATGVRSAWSPQIEVKEQDGNLVVCADLPGMNPEDVNVELTDEGLVIEGERKQERTEERGGVRRSERSYGRFYRVVPIPEGVNAEQAHAHFHNGVLEVKVPMPQEQQPQRRRIPIQGGSSQTGGAQPGTSNTGETPDGGLSENMGTPGGPGTSSAGSNTGSSNMGQGGKSTG